MRRDMGMVITLFLAIAAMVVGYAAFGQGGGVAGMVFFGVLLIGAAIRVLQQTVSNTDLR
jgi:prepilin signal peptidase PulO-like enzyme (type II secretory pathway)